ncbi:MAG: hypothetical protein ABI877_05480 [Gemmatimonadaceae bacterium]
MIGEFALVNALLGDGAGAYLHTMQRPDHPQPGARDTDAATEARYLTMIRHLPKAERLGRALALTALARELAWQGAVRNAGAQGHRAIVQRFLEQLYGAEFAQRFASVTDLSSR